MNRQRTLELLARSKPELQARFGVTRLALFGSTARDMATSGSDVDILVAFDGPATSKRYFGCSSTWKTFSAALSTWSLKRPCDRSCAPTSTGSGSMSDAARREWRFYLRRHARLPNCADQGSLDNRPRRVAISALPSQIQCRTRSRLDQPRSVISSVTSSTMAV